MTRFLKVMTSLLAASLTVLLLVTVTIYYRWTRSPLPVVDGEVRLAGLKAPVTVLRDSWGVPHIQAATQEDLFFAQGYVTAEDRLFQMDLLRRAASGRLSEVLGESQLQTDREQRNLGLRLLAERSQKTLSTEHLRVLEAYARGVNASINARAGRLPVEFRLLGYTPEPWTVTDTLSLGKLMSYALQGTWRRDLMRAELKKRLRPEVYRFFFNPASKFDRFLVGTETEHATTQTSVDIPEELFAAVSMEATIYGRNDRPGSNNWVIAGSRASTGKPILAGDPHQQLSLPSLWYQVHLKAEDGSYHAAGVSIVGTPCIVIGHNERVAWTVTNLMEDVQDLYLEEFDPAQPHSYRVGDTWQQSEARREKIKVRASLLGNEIREVDHEVIVTRHGPIVASYGKHGLALQWTSYIFDYSEFVPVYKVNLARDWAEFRAALREAHAPGQNFVYADVDGNIGFQSVSRLPLREAGDGSLPYDGSSTGVWERFVPFEEMPSEYNPERGYTGSANQRIAASGYPYTISNDPAPPYRAWRIDELLKAKTTHTPEEMSEMQADTYSVQIQLFTDVALKMARRHAQDPEWQDLARELEGWDGRLASDSRAAAVGNRLREEFTEIFYVYWLGSARPVYDWYLRGLIIDRVALEQPREWLPSSYNSYDEMMLAAYRLALASLTKELGADRTEWRYGAINRLTFEHPLAQNWLLSKLLNPPTLEPGGSVNTLNAIYISPDRVSGPGMRMVVSLADFDATSQTVVPGVSAHPASPHYSDQIPDWLAARPHQFPFSARAVINSTRHSLKLLP